MSRTMTPTRRRRVKDRTDFIWHLGTYLIMHAFFVAIAAMAGTGYTWVLWVAIPWGLGVAFHALATFVSVTQPADEYDAVDREHHQHA